MTLNNFDFVQKLTQHEKIFLYDILKPVTIAKDTILFFQGDLCQDILLIETGEVKVYLHSPNFGTVTLYYLKPGEQCIVNTSSAISATPAIASAQSITDIQGWLLSKKSAKELILKSENYQNFIFSLFTIKLASLAQIIEEIKFSTLEERLLKKFQTSQKHMLQTTHEELATELGSSRVSISRVLKQLEQKEKIKLHRGKIEIL